MQVVTVRNPGGGPFGARATQANSERRLHPTAEIIAPLTPQSGAPAVASPDSMVFRPGICQTLAVSMLTMLAACDPSSEGPVPVQGENWQVSAPTTSGGIVTDGERYYVGTRTHEAIAIDRATKRVVWRSATGPGGFRTAQANAVLAQGTVVVADGALFGFDPRTGEQRWAYWPTIGGAPGSFGIASDGSLIFAGSGTGHVYAVDPLTGEERWTFTASDQPTVNVNTPVVANGIVVVTYREISAFHEYGGVVAVSAATGAPVWHQRLVPDPPHYFSGANSGPVIGDGVVVAANEDGRLHAYSLADGALLWTAPRLTAFGGTQEVRYLATSGGLVIASSTTGILAAYSLSDGTKQWERSAGFGSTFGPLVASDAYVFAGNFSGQIAIISLADGTVLWKLGEIHNGQSAPFWPYPLVDGKTLVVPGESAVFGFRLP